MALSGRIIFRGTCGLCFPDGDVVSDAVVQRHATIKGEGLPGHERAIQEAREVDQPDNLRGWLALHAGQRQHFRHQVTTHFAQLIAHRPLSSHAGLCAL